MKNLIRIILFVGIIFMAGCGQSNENKGNNEDNNADLTPVTFALDWTPNTNHTGIYVAKEKGYFEEQGLDVEILLPGEVGVNQLLAAERADFGISYQEGLTQARSEGLPLVSIAAVLQHNTAGYASPVEKGITSPKDFEGKKFGAYGSDLEKAMMKTLMENDNADVEEVDYITTGDSDFFVAVERDVDFSLVFYGWTGIEAELRGVDLNMVYLADFSDELDYYTPIIATSEEMISTDPELVKAFTHAAVKGYEFAVEHPEDAAQILIDHVPDLDPDLVKRSQDWISPRYQDDADQFGTQEQERWQKFADFLLEYEIIDEPVDIEQAFTNEFLPKK
ncbi:ABC transporter substrate-binding protein [Ornithinibacillus halophilus]|uniref:ABC-type nitrate/sulfonate/bicarbonate transport system, substrate-binding protein n=1 Tax=Ornithinibacillus halophilus TaxID=930117 RepID=A0A1M5L0T6_9BACI|nr:ABC transporter substrate-binding protein [Ornithinibacillus halophilus]SHG58694.1 ABC-type nitrate/sulfonate/bicarbonate transport system, substrate-binding protein [Ornithinibacillus halophilus]